MYKFVLFAFIGLVLSLHAEAEHDHFGNNTPELTDAEKYILAVKEEERSGGYKNDLQSFREDFLEQGLPRSMRHLVDEKGNYIFLIVHAPKYFFDWTGPAQLKSSIESSYMASKGNLNVGHVQVAWHCQGDSGRVMSGATGLTGETKNQAVNMAADGWGLSFLFANFNDGHLENSAAVEVKMRKSAKKGALRWLGFKVEKDNCMRMTNFLKKFVANAGVNYIPFGFQASPDRYQGGGCSRFVHRALRQSNVFRAGIQDWKRDLHISPKWMAVGKNPISSYYKTEIAPGFEKYISDENEPVDVDMFDDIESWSSVTDPKVEIYDTLLVYSPVEAVNHRFFTAHNYPEIEDLPDGDEQYEKVIRRSVGWLNGMGALEYANQMVQYNEMLGSRGIIVSPFEDLPTALQTDHVAESKKQRDLVEQREREERERFWEEMNDRN